MHLQILRARFALLAAVLFVAGCTGGGATFQPSGPCTTDGQRPGAYPALEALVPTSLAGRKPDRLDSGRSCSDKALGTLVTHGVSELRYAGGLWQLGSNSGTTLVVFDSPTPLQPSWLGEFYEASARAANKTENIQTKPVNVGSAAGYRLDTLNDDSYQTVVVWPHDGRVVAALVGSSVREVTTRAGHDEAVKAALAAFGTPAG
ncbi:MAG TPA: hypothetical protein VGC90_09605 [Candidatus Limnocylindrales bacterium]